MSTVLEADPRKNTILLASLAVFARYGFKRVAMSDIAEEANMSRPALYLAYPNKTAIFEALARAMAEKVCRDARVAWNDNPIFSQGLRAAALALHLDGWRLLKGSPHGGELISANSAVVGEIAASVDTWFGDLVHQKLMAVGQTDFDAKLIVAALAGVKDKATTEPELVIGVTQLSKIMALGLGLE